MFSLVKACQACQGLLRLVQACQGLSSLSRLVRASKHISSIFVAVLSIPPVLAVKRKQWSRAAHHRRIIHNSDIFCPIWVKLTLFPKRCSNTGTIKALEADNHRYLQLFPRSVDLRCQITISRKTKNQESFYSENTQSSRDTDKMEPGRALFEDSTPQPCIWTYFGLN